MAKGAGLPDQEGLGSRLREPEVMGGTEALRRDQGGTEKPRVG